MNISKIGENKIKVILNSKDMEKLGVSFEDINSDELTAKIFIGSLLTLLRDLGILKLKNGDVIVDVAKKSSKEIIVYIETEKKSGSKEKITALYTFNNSQKLINFCQNTLRDFTDDISHSILLSLKNKYFLLIDYKMTAPEFKLCREISTNALTDMAAIGKIKEYAVILSRTPLEKIFDLPR